MVGLFFDFCFCCCYTTIMKTFSTVEDYLEVMAGKREPDGSLPANTLSFFGLGYDFKPIVSLARYDVNFLDSVTNATMGGASLTDKQAELSLKIIEKYTRQLLALNIKSEAIVTAPKYRRPLRIIDRSKSVEVSGSDILVRFPYDQKLIDHVREHAKDSQGRVRFDKENKVWRLGLTEYNLNWAAAFAQSQGFETTKQLQDMMVQILEAEKTPYRIELTLYNNRLTIRNASKDLLEFLGNEENSWPIEDLIQLVDSSEVLGYTVDDDLVQAYTDLYGTDMSVMLRTRHYDFKEYNWPNLEQSIYKYAQLANRFPIVVFDPQTNFGAWEHLVDESLILNLSKVRGSDERQVCQDTNAQIILSNRAVKYFDRIPLLVSHLGMIVGQDKRIMLDASEKVFYRNGKLA